MKWLIVVLALGISVPAIGQNSQGSAWLGVEELPIEGMIKIVQEDGSLIYLSSNRRFAFVGTMYDLWRGEALELGVGISQRIDLERNGVSIRKIAIPVGDQWSTSTLFIAPECQDCKDLLAAALSLLDDDLNVVMLASSAEGRLDNAAVWCAKDRARALRSVYLEDTRPEQDELIGRCDRFGLMLAEEAAMLFGIAQLPLFLGEDGIGYVGADAIRAVTEKAASRQARGDLRSTTPP